MTLSRADAYAQWARAGADASFEPTLATLLALLPPAPLEVLDVGCGEGRFGRELLERGYEVVGVDSDPRMVELARERHRTTVADAASLPFAASSFPCVITVHALMEMDPLQPPVNEIARVLQPSAIAVAIVEHPFASAAKVRRYSEESRYGWNVAHEGVDLVLGGVHRPLSAYVDAFEQAGLKLDTLREISVDRWDPMSLALRFVAPSGYNQRL